MEFKEALAQAMETGEMPLTDEPPSDVEEQEPRTEDLGTESLEGQAAVPSELNEEVVSEEIPDSDPEPEPEPTEPEPIAAEETEQELADLNAYFRTAVGRDVSFEEAQQMLDAMVWQQSLTQEQVERVTAALQDPAAVPPSTPGLAPAAPANLDLSGFDLLEEDQKRLEATLATYVDGAVTPLRDQVAASQDTIEQYQVHQVDEQNRRLEGQIVTGLEKFGEAHPELSPEEIAGLRTRIQNQNSFHTFLASNENDGDKAVQAAMETYLFADKDMRAKFIASEAKAEVSLIEEDKERQQNLASLGGGNNGGTPDLTPASVVDDGDDIVSALSRALSA